MVEELQEISFEEDSVAQSVYVGFRMRADTLEPHVVTDALQIQPSSAWAKGDQYLGRARDPVTKQMVQVWRKRPWGIWRIDSKNFTETKRVEAHIVYLLNILEPQQDRIKFFINHPEEYSVSFYIHWEPKSGYGSYEISSTTLSKMAALCHNVECSFL